MSTKPEGEKGAEAKAMMRYIFKNQGILMTDEQVENSYAAFLAHPFYSEFAAAQPPADPLGEGDDKIREWLKEGSKGVCRWVSADERLPEGYNRIPVKWSETGYDIGDRSRIKWLMSLGHKNVRWLEDLPSSPSTI